MVLFAEVAETLTKKSHVHLIYKFPTSNSNKTCRDSDLYPLQV